MLSALAARPITTPIEPGPESMGIAIGVREISLLAAASSVSAGVIRVEAVTMPQAVWATISPPATFSTGNEIPKKLRTKRPKNMKTTRMPKHIHRGLYGGAVALAFAEIRRKREKQRYAAERIHDRK